MKRRVKIQLDRHKYAEIEVEEEKIRIVTENNREVWRNTKREIRYRKTVSYSLDELRDRTGYEPKDMAQSAEETILEAEQRTALRRAILKLQTREKRFIEMIYYEGRTQDEVAAAFGISKQAVSNAMQRIYAKLKT